ncbi:MAG: hypothetical protein ACI3Y4_03585 [Candidatus Cryptobacteroides sp.]
MKTRKIFAAALALPMLFACTKVEIVPTEKPAQGDKGFDISVTVNFDNETKAVFDDTEGILWENPGSAGLVTSEYNDVKAQCSTAANPSEDGRQSTFKFEGITAGTYRLFYPYCETYYPNIKFTVSANQTQDAEGKSSDIFAGMATDNITAVEGENSVDVKYQTVGSYIQFLVYGKTGEIVRYVSVVSSDSKIAGDYTVNAESFDHTVLEGGSERVLVALGDAGYTTTATAEEATGIYAAVLPGSSKNTYYVTTDKSTYVFESSAAKDFAAGSIKTVKLNLDNAKVVEQTVPNELYIVGNVAFVGWDCTKAIKMEKSGNVFSTDVYLSTQVKNPDNTITDAEGFKFLTQTVNWHIGYVKGTDGKLTYRSETNGVDDTKFTVDKAGYYHVEANFDTGEVTCTPKAPEKLYVWGAATEAGWDSNKAIELTKSAENECLFTATDILLTGCADFKFFSENSEFTAYVNDGSGNVVFFDSPTGSEADKKFNIAHAGKFDLSVDLSTGKWNYTIKEEYPYVISNKTDSYVMCPTGVEGEYSAVAYIGYDSGYHDFFVKFGDTEAYNGSWTEVVFDANLEYSVNVTKAADNGTGWYINDGNKKTARLYRITLNTNTNTLTVKFAQGKNFWLIGTPFAGYDPFNKPEAFKGTADENGIVIWNVTTTKTGDFKICGEYTRSDAFWEGEWYYSTEDNESAGYKFNWSWGSGENDNNYSTELTEKQFDVRVFCANDQKWNFNETGTFEIVFDTRNLKIKVTKK